MIRRLVFLLCLLPIQVWAAEPSQELEKATLLFRQMNYRGALKVAQQVLRSAESQPEDLVSAYRIQGLCLSALGRESKAVQSFKRLLAIDPSFRLSRDISPKLAPPFAKALRLVGSLDPISLVHQEPESPESLAGFPLKVTLQADPFEMVVAVRLQYQTGGAWKQLTASGVKTPGTITMVLPDEIESAGMSYYFEAQNRYGGILARAGSPNEPFRVETSQKARPLVAIETPPPFPDPGKSATEPVVPEPPGDDRRRSEEERTNGTPPWYKSWWFWTVVGVVAAGAATATVLAVGSTSTTTFYYDIQVE